MPRRITVSQRVTCRVVDHHHKYIKAIAIVGKMRAVPLFKKKKVMVENYQSVPPSSFPLTNKLYLIAET